MKHLTFFKLLALVACLTSALSASAYNYSTTVNGKVIYLNQIGGFLEVTYKDTNYNSYSGDVSIPAAVSLPNGLVLQVTSIGENAFRNCSNLTSVAFTDQGLPVTIGAYAFYNCNKLTSFDIPSLTTIIGKYAFYNCGLTSISVPASVQAMGSSVFAECSRLNNVEFLATITAIPDSTFYRCTSLTKFAMPHWISIIQKSAFQECTALNDLTIGANVTEIGRAAFNYCYSLTDVVIPDKVTTISDFAFQHCRKMERFTIGSNVTSIGEYALWFNGTTTEYDIEMVAPVEIHSRATTPPTITNYTFGAGTGNYDPYPRHKIYVHGPYAQSLYQAATYWKNFYNIYTEQPYDFLTGGIYYLISGDNTVKVTNKYGEGRISWSGYDGDYSYRGSVTIPNTAYDSYTGKTYNVTAIANNAFDESPRMMINGSEAPSLRNQGDLTSVTMGSSVTTIGKDAFKNCTGLTSVTLGSGVSSIGATAFYGCTALATLTCQRSTPATIQSTTFDNSHYSTVTLKVPSTSAVNSYKAATYWKNFYLIVPNGGELNYALNASGTSLSFTNTTTDYPWIVKGDGTRIYAMSGNAGVHSSTSTIIAQVTVSKLSTVTFDFKAWGEGTSYDKCEFLIDGVVQFTYGARDNDWETFTADLPVGSHVLTWTYSKDGSQHPTGDYFAVDNVKVTEKAVETGDVNGDNNVSIADVTALIDLLLGGGSVTNPACDVNGDGNVSIADVTALIDMLLSGN